MSEKSQTRTTGGGNPNEGLSRERPAAEDRHELELLLGRMLAVVSEGIVVTDGARNIMRFSTGAEEIFGWSEAEVTGWPLDVLIPMPYRSAHGAHMDRFAVSEGTARTMHERAVVSGLRRDGSEFPARIAIARANHDGFIAIVRDLTHDRRNEIHMREAQRIARLGHWVYRVADGHLEWSEEVYRIFGLDPQSHAPDYDSFLDRVVPEDRQAVLDAVAAALEMRERYQVEHRIVTAGGAVRWVREEAEIEFDADGSPQMMIGIVQDITERREAEARMGEAQRRAEAANEAKSRFLATMSHELRTPLNAVLGFSDLIAGEVHGALDPVYREYAQHIHTAGEQLLDLVENVLEATREETGDLRFSPERVHGSRLADEITTFAAPLAPADGPALSFGPCPQVQLEIDPRLVRQAVLNLISNAVKFAPDGSSVDIAYERRADGGFAIAVRDRGPGIPAERLDEVFRPFTQVDDTLSRRFGGVGLGLYLARAFMERHGGRIEFLPLADGVGTLAAAVVPSERTAWPEG